jgi:hypothetical protein
VTVSPRNTLRRQRFLVVVALFILIGLALPSAGRYSHFRPFDWATFFRVVPWTLLGGAIAGIIIVSSAIALYSPFPRSLRGKLTLESVDDGKIWFYGTNGQRHHLS